MAAPIYSQEQVTAMIATPKYVPHKYVYNERAIREDWPWDKCAEPLKLKSRPRKKLSIQQCIDWIAPIFLNDTHVEIHDPDSMELFGR